MFLKKSSYKIKDIKEELNLNLKSLLDDIEFSDNICLLVKELHLHKRVFYIFREYERIIKIWNTTTTNFNDDTYSAQYFNNKIIPLITESAEEMRDYYECYSEEINIMFKKIESFGLDVALRLGSSGWSGNILVLGSDQSISKIGNHLLDFYSESFENRGQYANFWMSDEVQKFCYWSEIGGSTKILNPIYEDFMIIDLK